MSEGRGRGNKGRGRRRGRGRGRGGNEARTNESVAPSGLQDTRSSDRGAIALTVDEPTPSVTQATPSQEFQVSEDKDQAKSTSKKQRQRRKKQEQTSQQETTSAQASNVKNPTAQQDVETLAKNIQQLKVQEQSDSTDGAFPSRSADTAPTQAPKDTQPKTTPVTPQEQTSKKSTSQPVKKTPSSATQQEKPELKQLPTDLPQSEKEEIILPRRPDKGGQLGRPIRLRVNFLEVQLPKNDIHHYDTSIKANFKTNRDGYTKSEAPKIIKEMVNQYEAANPKGPKLVYDKDGKNLYCRTLIPDIGKDMREFKVLFTTDNGSQREYTVTVKWAAQVSLYYLKQALDGKSIEVPQNAVQAVQNVIRFLPSMTSTPFGNSFFNFYGDEKDLGLGLQIWNGRFVSIRPTQWKMMLNIDICATAFYKAQPVLDFMCEYLQLRNIPPKLNPSQRRDFSKEMKTIKIETTHVKRKQRVSGLSMRSSKDEKFPLEDGKTISVFEYFKEKYNIALRYPDLPCLKVGSKGSLIPIEVSNIAGGQRREGRLNPDQTREMIRHTALPAPQRQREIENLVHSSNFDKDPYCADFGIKVGRNLASVTGRVLDPPLLSYGPKDRPQTEKPRDGVWNMQNKPMFQPIELKEWALISYENPRFFDDRAMSNFISRLVQAGGEKQLRINDTPCYKNTQRGYEGIGKLFGQLIKNYPNLQLIVVIFPGKDSTDPYYEEVKHYGDVVYGMRTQCVKSKNAKKADMQTMANICLKINAKLGGTTSVLNKGIRSPILSRPVIIFGADVTHPAPGDSSPSIAAVVASMDSYPNQYCAEVRVQQRGSKTNREEIGDMKNIVVTLLRKFRDSTGVAPQKIIFYRDGVGEGQFKRVLLLELQAFQHACRELHPNYKPQITFIVVQKRHHARFFAEDPRDQRGKSKNIPAGTLVDKDVVHPFEFDWYLCSHAGIQGTSKPTHYHVLYDDSNFKSDELQNLTNQLCHTYVRCARAVSIPAPVYYAHHVAFRARYHLKEVERGSPDGSVASGGDGSVLKEEDLVRAVKIHDNMNSTMYFA
ncbi:protein argonaute-2-like isoform X1 [Xenia sp. Carnegie-2017]|uniref:protein argonaute-2-like isoform X1 n=1 Tax=Xenia sp. Carnegie-2017 TaxID=2897299 RepID=UPI001F035588|nr:protein argonaute-2-like isoform X1 [Xenia sp. Carnegie-2017]